MSNPGLKAGAKIMASLRDGAATQGFHTACHARTHTSRSGNAVRASYDFGNNFPSSSWMIASGGFVLIEGWW